MRFLYIHTKIAKMNFRREACTFPHILAPDPVIEDMLHGNQTKCIFSHFFAYVGGPLTPSQKMWYIGNYKIAALSRALVQGRTRQRAQDVEQRSSFAACP